MYLYNKNLTKASADLHVKMNIFQCNLQINQGLEMDLIMEIENGRLKWRNKNLANYCNYIVPTLLY